MSIGNFPVTLESYLEIAIQYNIKPYNMTILRQKAKSRISIATVLLIVFLSSANMVNAGVIVSEYMSAQDVMSHSSSCVSEDANVKCKLVLEESEHDHSHCNDFHCSGAAVPTSYISDSSIGRLSLIGSESTSYTSALLPSLYMPPIGIL